MNLKIEKNKLVAVDEIISSSDSLIHLQTDLDCVIIGVLDLFNGGKKVIEFVKEKSDSTDKFGRLIIDEKDLTYLSSAKFYIELINGELTRKTNVINVKFDLSAIKLDIKKSVSNEYKEIKEAIAKLEQKITYFSNNKVLDGINITNKDLIKPGMIPVAIDEKGNFVALYPFSNCIVEVNGKRAANGAVIIDASMIKYKKNGKSIEKALDDQASAIISLKKVVDEIINNQKEIRRQLNDLDYKLEHHINNGIV